MPGIASPFRTVRPPSTDTVKPETDFVNPLGQSEAGRGGPHKKKRKSLTPPTTWLMFAGSTSTEVSVCGM